MTDLQKENHYKPQRKAGLPFLLQRGGLKTPSATLISPFLGEKRGRGKKGEGPYIKKIKSNVKKNLFYPSFRQGEREKNKEGRGRGGMTLTRRKEGKTDVPPEQHIRGKGPIMLTTLRCFEPERPFLSSSLGREGYRLGRKSRAKGS